ncbi:DeSI-like protein [Cardamine amara subsp. amara]|uniref:DeSI-like protein n=1 Tax=Cardamine amara subsp. amara TaxID=228776 RepID=A0ABD1A1X9_CARAN
MWGPTLSSSSCSSEEREESNGEARLTPAYLNVYDLTPVNNYLHWFGIGIFHSGIEAHVFEYCYGAHGYPTSGVYELTGKPIPGWINRLARVGSFCNCLLPESIQLTAVGALPERLEFSDEEDSNSEASSVSDEEGSEQHLMNAGDREIVCLQNKPVRLTREEIP